MKKSRKGKLMSRHFHDAEIATGMLLLFAVCYIIYRVLFYWDKMVSEGKTCFGSEQMKNVWELVFGNEAGFHGYGYILVRIMFNLVVALIFAALVLYVSTRNDKKIFRQQKENIRIMREAEKKANQENKEKTRMLAQISHDIRTPISNVMGMTSIARESFADKEKMEDCLDKIDISSTYLLSLINKLLDFSQIEDGSFKLLQEPFSVPELLKTCGDMLEGQIKEKCICFSEEFSKIKHPVVLGDCLHVQQILVNILGNAVKYTPTGGKVTLFALEKEMEDEKARFCFVVQDTGIGMKEEFLERIYQPYAKEDEDAGKRYHGTGLGMTIVKQYIDAMKGTIQIERNREGGTCMVVQIAFPVVEEPPYRKTDISVNGMFAGKKVLVAEDMLSNQKIMEFYLKNMGFTVDTAQNGKEVVEAYLQAETGEYAAILMDVMMPELDGLEATKVIRESDREDAEKIPIVAVTACAFEEECMAIRAAGMNGYLLKPLSEAVIYAEMMRCMSPTV